MNIKNLIQAAVEVQKNAYAPYSNFPVGAALLTKDGKIYTGVNMENASYGGTICAERNAIGTAVAAGYTVGDFQKIAIISQMENVTPPCSICRQVLNEFFDPEVEVIMCNKHQEYKIETIKTLVPYGFSTEELNDV